MIIDAISDCFNKYRCSLSLFLNLILSLAYNSADYTDSNAFLKIKIIRPDNARFKKITFIFYDSGEGISTNYKGFIEQKGIRRGIDSNNLDYSNMFENPRSTKSNNGMGLVNIKAIA